MLSKLFFLNSLKEKRKPQDSTDELAIVKAAAWAWYQHGSGSEGKAMPMSEFDVRRTQHVTRSSRYKLEAMRMTKEAKEEGPQVHTKKSLLDTYEMQSISRQLERLIETESGHKKLGNGNNSANGGLDNGSRRMKKMKRINKGFWSRHGVVCGRGDDVVDGSASRGDRLSAKHAPIVRVLK